MALHRRFLWILSLGILFTVIAYPAGWSWPVFIFYNFTAFIFLGIDFYQTQSGSKLQITRTGSERLSIYANEKIAIAITNTSKRIVWIEMKDEIPDFHFIYDRQPLKGCIRPNEKVTFEYQVEPKKRGAFLFGNVHIRVASPLKLCYRSEVIFLQKEYKVYPNVQDLRKYRLMVAKNQFREIGRQPLQVQQTGTAFESLREYVLGDEYRKINWNATARENKLIVNQYQPEKNQSVFILIDSGRPMSYEIRGQKKLDLAINTALILSDIVLQNGDQSGLMTFNTEVQSVVMPASGAAQREQIMNELYHIEHSIYTSNFEDAFYQLTQKQRRRSLICIFTDFDSYEEAEDMMRVVPILKKNNLVMVILIESEKLKQYAQTEVNSERQIFEKGVALELLAERQLLIRKLRSLGVFCIETPVEKLTISTINAYLKTKNRMAL